MVNHSDDQIVWLCVYCNRLIPVEDTYVDPIDHMLDFHRVELVKERPLLARRVSQPGR